MQSLKCVELLLFVLLSKMSLPDIKNLVFFYLQSNLAHKICHLCHITSQNNFFGFPKSLDACQMAKRKKLS